MVNRRLPHESLTAAVHIAALIVIGRRRGVNIDDVPTLPLHHAGQDRARAIEHTLDVRIDDRFSIAQSRLVRRFQAQPDTRIVHKDRDVFEVFRQLRDRREDRGGIPQIESQSPHRIFEILARFILSVRMIVSGNDARAFARVAPCRGSADTGPRTGNQDDFIRRFRHFRFP